MAVRNWNTKSIALLLSSVGLPREITTCLSGWIYLVHQPNLTKFLIIIALIDAETIDPYVDTAVFPIQGIQNDGDRLRYAHERAIGKYNRGVIRRISPRVWDCEMLQVHHIQGNRDRSASEMLGMICVGHF